MEIVHLTLTGVLQVQFWVNLGKIFLGLSDEYFDTSDGQASSSDVSLHVCSNG